MSDGFSQFLSTIGQIPVLTKAEEQELAKRIEKGDVAAKEKLVRHNIRLAVHVARRYNSSDIPLEDLVQEAMIGVDRAAEKFDWRKDIKFSTYATWWIRHMIQRALYKDRTTIRVPGHIIARRKSLEKYMREHIGASLYEAADELGITHEQADDATDGARVVKSLDAPRMMDGSEAGDSHALFADDTAPDPAEVTEDPHPGLHEALNKLTDLERRVIELRFGFDGTVRSRDEVAELLQVSVTVVQKSQRSAIKTLRKHLGADADIVVGADAVE